MSVTETLPDVEGAVVALLRAFPAVASITGARTFFGIPKGATEATFPLNVVQRVGGGDDPGEAPVDLALIQIDCWGRIGASGNGLKAECTAQTNAVRSALRSITGSTDGSDVAGITVQSVIWLPDPSNDRPRYVVTAEATAIDS